MMVLPMVMRLNENWKIGRLHHYTMCKIYVDLQAASICLAKIYIYIQAASITVKTQLKIMLDN